MEVRATQQPFLAPNILYHQALVYKLDNGYVLLLYRWSKEYVHCGTADNMMPRRTTSFRFKICTGRLYILHKTKTITIKRVEKSSIDKINLEREMAAIKHISATKCKRIFHALSITSKMRKYVFIKGTNKVDDEPWNCNLVLLPT